MAYIDFNTFPEKTAADKVLRDKPFKFVKKQNMMKTKRQRELASLVHKYFDKASSGSRVRNEIMLKEELAEELYKPIIKKCEKRKVYSSFKTIFGALILQICN